MTPAAPDHRSEEDETSSFGAWTLVWVICLTKLVTVVGVLVMVHSREATVLLTITTWFWLGPLVALGASPLLFRWRLRRIRAKRRALLAAEWLLADDPDVVATGPR
jgi:hypothetical protein